MSHTNSVVCYYLSALKNCMVYGGESSSAQKTLLHHVCIQSVVNNRQSTAHDTNPFNGYSSPFYHSTRITPNSFQGKEISWGNISE